MKGSVNLLATGTVSNNEDYLPVLASATDLLTMPERAYRICRIGILPMNSRPASILTVHDYKSVTACLFG